MKVATNIKIPIEELLDSMGIIYCEADKQTLINQPIIFNEKPIGIITKISEDGKYVEGLLWLEMGIECEYASISDTHLVAKGFSGIYIINNTNEDIINFKNGSSIKLIKEQGKSTRGNRSNIIERIESNMEEMITISKRYLDQLERDSALLEALENAGVDNWGGYGDAMEMLEESEED